MIRKSDVTGLSQSASSGWSFASSVGGRWRQPSLSDGNGDNYVNNVYKATMEDAYTSSNGDESLSDLIFAEDMDTNYFEKRRQKLC